MSIDYVIEVKKRLSKSIKDRMPQGKELQHPHVFPIKALNFLKNILKEGKCNL